MTKRHDPDGLSFGLCASFVIRHSCFVIAILFNLPAQIARFVPEMSFNGSPDVRTKSRS